MQGIFPASAKPAIRRFWLRGVRTDLIPHRNLLTFEAITQTGVLQG